MRRAWAAATAVLVLAGGLGASTASAAQLDVRAGDRPSLSTASACAATMVGGVPVVRTTATGTSASHVSVTGVPAPCRSRVIEVFVHNASGVRIATGVLAGGTAANGSATVPVPAYSTAAVGRVVARIGGWIFPTTWTEPPPPAPYSCVGATSVPQGTGQACTVTPSGGTSWGSAGSRRGHQSFSVTTSAPNAIVTIDLSKSPFPGWTVRAVVTNHDWIKVPGYSCSELPLVRVYADPSKGGKGQSLYLEYRESAQDNQGAHVICPGP